MKYEYGLEDNVANIKNYKVNEVKKKIAISTFSKKPKSVYDYTEENEKRTLLLMLNQAKQRNANEDLIPRITELRKKNLFITGAAFICMVVTIGLKSEISGLNHSTLLYYCLNIPTVCFFVASLAELRIKNGIVEELKKEKIYLEIKSGIDAINASDPYSNNLYRGLNILKQLMIKIRPLDIKTLDCLSLKDLRCIKKNLIDCEAFDGQFEKVRRKELPSKKTNHEKN